MTDDSGEASPPTPPALSDTPLAELIARGRAVADWSSLMTTRGELMVALRARGLTWRQIEDQTGIPRQSAHRWAQQYLDAQ